MFGTMGSMARQHFPVGGRADLRQAQAKSMLLTHSGSSLISSLGSGRVVLLEVSLLVLSRGSWQRRHVRRGGDVMSTTSLTAASKPVVFTPLPQKMWRYI